MSDFIVDENVDELDHPILPYIQVLGHYIRNHTTYRIEISSLEPNDIKRKFFQIDEVDNKFYFTFFPHKLEFAIGNFDNYMSIPWDVMFTPDNVVMITNLRNLGASESLIKACQKFLDFCIQSRESL